MHSMTRRSFLGSSLLGAAAFAGPVIPASQERKPNVLFIMTDQQRKETLACYGNEKVRTPALDSVSVRGVRFTSCYATQPVCSPCRSSMATGLFPNATGVVENKIPLRPDLFTWPRALREEGYKVGYIGKWHLGTDPVPEYFDTWQGFDTGWNHWVKEEPVYQKPGETEEAFEKRISSGDTSTSAGKDQIGRYRPDLEADHAIEFIKRHADSPFACWLSFYPPHTPKTAPVEDLALYKGKFETEEQDTYYAMVHRIDANVGRVLNALDELGLRENTLIVFTSDHGENFPARWNGHHKRLCYDQAANVPLLVSWPGHLPEGKEIVEPISIADLAPTILDLCGLPWPDTLHGTSARRLLSGDPSGWHEDVYIQNTPYRPDAGVAEGIDLGAMRERCVVTKEWKLILNTTREPELYNRQSAVPDQQNLFGSAGALETTRDLVHRLTAWGEKTGDTQTRQLIDQWSPRWA